MRNPLAGAFVISLLAAAHVHGQTPTPPVTQTYVVDQKLPSLRAPFGYIVPYSIAVQMETKSATTGKQVGTGSVAKLPAINFVSDGALLGDFIANKSATAPVIVSSLSVTLTTAMASGWEQKAPWGLRVWLDTPFAVAAGQAVGCRYDMPVQGFDILKSATATVVNMDPTIVWRKDVTGNLRCAVGVKAANITPPMVLPIPPAPPATPTPTVVASKPGDACDANSPANCFLTATDAAKWTIVVPRVFRNGVDMVTGNPAAYSDFNLLFIHSDGRLCANSPTHGYLCWNGASWGA